MITEQREDLQLAAAAIAALRDILDSNPSARERNDVLMALQQLVCEFKGGRNPRNYEGFDEFWTIMPKRNGRKLDKKLARDRWGSMTPAQHQTAMNGAMKYRKTMGADSPYARNPSTFLSNEFYADWVEDVVVPVTVERPKNAGPQAVHDGTVWLR